MALRTAVLRHIRIRSNPLPQRSLRPSRRLFSSHDDHLTKDEVIGRVLDVVKSFPKVDPSKVALDVHFQKDLGQVDSCNLAIEYIYNHPMTG
ncbi:mitochondrial acyl carrier protein 1, MITOCHONDRIAL ACYL CARRIER PROTEIN 1 [Hibiscus trionum]|uniref:Mitochondrial acyl carrier protein 1, MITOCHONDRIAL ACYL CARRIER PROTEIN 1 n=1 Tax=Hibiscus trionum TaxID=183268 RepID=A0A9W7GY51_HIBTR|nr:mitochondrial acyl carrier protein 1, MITOCHONDRIAL ACYL CARRIER PROTEIN 1 [Hibiscus trionum]